jgi:hypothetical protein
MAVYSSNHNSSLLGLRPPSTQHVIHSDHRRNTTREIPRVQFRSIWMVQRRRLSPSHCGILYRWPLHWTRRGQFLPFAGHAEHAELYIDRPSSRRITNAGMLWPRSRSALPCAFIVAPIFTGSPNPYHPDTSGHIACVLGGHPALRSAHVMGWLDCISGYHPDNHIQCRDLRNAKDTGQQKGAQEANRRECRHEWDQLLPKPQSDSHDGRHDHRSCSDRDSSQS